MRLGQGLAMTANYYRDEIVNLAAMQVPDYCGVLAK